MAVILTNAFHLLACRHKFTFQLLFLTSVQSFKPADSSLLWLLMAYLPILALFYRSFSLCYTLRYKYLKMSVVFLVYKVSIINLCLCDKPFLELYTILLYKIILIISHVEAITNHSHISYSVWFF